LPDVKGPEFLRRLRLSDPEMPVIIVTGYPDRTFMTEATEVVR
jgi:FixJ family two-component response regulator